MRTALETARGAGKSLFFSGANDVYWKIRFESSPTGALDRTMTVYKTHAERAGGPERHPDGHLARPGRRQQAGERASSARSTSATTTRSTSG